MSGMPEDAREVRAGALILLLARRTGEPCASCGKSLCGHELLFAVVLGHRDDPYCSACAAVIQGREPEALAADLRANIGRRDCYRSAWEWADTREGSCPHAHGTFHGARRDEDGVGAEGRRGSDVVPDAEWDAGNMACGDLVLELRRRMKAMGPSGTLLVTAHDPGASEDLPAWCRMTNHALAYARPPVYCIRNKEE